MPKFNLHIEADTMNELLACLAAPGRQLEAVETLRAFTPRNLDRVTEKAEESALEPVRRTRARAAKVEDQPLARTQEEVAAEEAQEEVAAEEAQGPTDEPETPADEPAPETAQEQATVEDVRAAVSAAQAKGREYSAKIMALLKAEFQADKMRDLRVRDYAPFIEAVNAL